MEKRGREQGRSRLTRTARRAPGSSSLERLLVTPLPRARAIGSGGRGRGKGNPWGEKRVAGRRPELRGGWASELDTCWNLMGIPARRDETLPGGQSRGLPTCLKVATLPGGQSRGLPTCPKVATSSQVNSCRLPTCFEVATLPSGMDLTRWRLRAGSELWEMRGALVQRARCRIRAFTEHWRANRFARDPLVQYLRDCACWGSPSAQMAVRMCDSGVRCRSWREREDFTTQVVL